MRLLYRDRQRYCYNGRIWQLLDHSRKGYGFGQRRLVSDSPHPTGDSSNMEQATKAQDDPVSNVKAAREHRPLPLPPLMDPVKLAARNKFRHSKRQPSGQNLTQLQRQLKNNPYAHALASPIRYYDAMHIRLPKAFLIGFELVAHPKSGAPWLVPSNLALPADPPCSESAADSDENASPDDVHDSQNLTSPRRLSTPASPCIYVLAKAFILHRLSKGGQSKSRVTGWSRLIQHPRLHQRYALQGKEIKSPKAMDQLVLRLLRLHIIRELAYLASRPRTGYVKSGREGITAAASRDRLGCVLWLGPPSPSSAQETKSKDQRSKEDLPWDRMSGPAPYAMMTTDETTKQHVVVYNLPHLLGTEYLAKLRENLGRHRDEEVLVLKSRRGVVRAQTWLWKLQGFLMTPFGTGK